MNEYSTDSKKGIPQNGYSSKLPEDVRQNLSAYKTNEDLLTREKLFQTLRAKDSKFADSQVGADSFKGYNGIFNAFNKAYGVSDEEQAMIDKYTDVMNNKKNGQMNQDDAMREMIGMQLQHVAANNNPAGGAMPGANTVSSLGILQKRK